MTMSTPKHKHDTIQDKGSGVEVFCSVFTEFVKQGAVYMIMYSKVNEDAYLRFSTKIKLCSEKLVKTDWNSCQNVASCGSRESITIGPN